MLMMYSLLQNRFLRRDKLVVSQNVVDPFDFAQSQTFHAVDPSSKAARVATTKHW